MFSANPGITEKCLHYHGNHDGSPVLCFVLRGKVSTCQTCI